MDPFRGRTALITGAASGIGRAVALALSEAGARVAALDLHGAALEKLGAEMSGRPFAWAAADVTDLAATRTAVADLEARLGPTDILLASAGIGRPTPADDFRAEDVADIVRVNLVGVANVIDAVLPGMRRRGAGHLAAVSSLASYRGIPRLGGYSASKAGLNALLESLRVELRPAGILVTTICPGWVRTPLTAQFPGPASVLMPVEKAARHIVAGLASRKPFVAFPRGLSLFLWLLRLLPPGLSDRGADQKVRRTLRE
jgi:NAD(P)-dependent dehydrogenase (short-subunit alcohol dehydrogenase family)